MDYLTTHTSLPPIRRGFASGFINYKKGCTGLAAASDKVYQLLAHGRCFSPAKTGRHDIAEILLKVVIKHNKSNQFKSNRNIGKQNNSKKIGSNKTIGPKHDGQNLIRSPMPEGGES